VIEILGIGNVVQEYGKLKISNAVTRSAVEKKVTFYSFRIGKINVGTVLVSC